MSLWCLVSYWQVDTFRFIPSHPWMTGYSVTSWIEMFYDVVKLNATQHVLEYYFYPLDETWSFNELSIKMWFWYSSLSSNFVNPLPVGFLWGFSETRYHWIENDFNSRFLKEYNKKPWICLKLTCYFLGWWWWWWILELVLMVGLEFWFAFAVAGLLNGAVVLVVTGSGDSISLQLASQAIR